MLYRLARPFIYTLPAEPAHKATIAALKALPARPRPALDPRLAMSVAGLDFAGPVGLAAGFDKNGEVPDAVLGLGFGFAEVGTVTPRPQSGNPRPRLFRLTEDRAVINRMGFNNEGGAAVAARLMKRPRKAGPLGINIGANKDSADRIADYVDGVRRFAGMADYLTVNISSPNTPGLRDLQQGEALDELIAAVMEARAGEAKRPPVFLKVAPDLEPAQIDHIVRVARDRGIDALIVSNTTISRPPLRSHHAGETGGLSGKPLAGLAAARLADFRRASGAGIPLIAAGGIDSAAAAWARIRAGASLVQLYSALVYAGPGLALAIHRALPRLIERDGFASLAEAVGVDAPA